MPEAKSNSKRISDTFKIIARDSANGALGKLRVIVSGLIGIAGVAGATFLLYTGGSVPREYFAIVAIAVFGVVGAEVATIIANRLIK